jgi:hypothetical protein
MRFITSKLTAIAATAVSMLLGITPARATGPEPKYVPADAKWVVHADVDRMAKTKTYDLVMRQAEKDDPKVREKLAKFGEALGTRFPEDVRGVTLVGRAFDEKSAVLIVRAKLDKDRLLGMAKAVPGFTSSMHGAIEVMTWKDANKPESISGAFMGDDTIVLGWTPADVGRMLDLAAGREQPALADGLLAGAADQTEVMAYLAGNGLAELQKMHPVSPLLSQVTSARVSLAEREDDLTLRAVLNVTSPEIANQVKGAMDGFKALLGLAGLDNDGDDEAKAAAEIVQRAAVTAEGSAVKLDLPMPVARLKELLEQEDDKKKAASAPVTRKSEDAEKPATP